MLGNANLPSSRKRWGGALALCLTIFGCPAVGMAQEAAPGIAEITYPDGHVEVFMQDALEVAAQNASSHIFQTRPAIRTSSKHSGEQITRQSWMCITIPGGVIIPDSDMRLELSREPNAGGHDHDDAGRDDHVGEYTPDAFNTGPTGISNPVEYKADEVSGTVNLRVECRPPNSSFWFPSLFTIGVEFPNLVPLPPHPAYDLVGTSTPTGMRHLSNHWVRSGFVPKLQVAADAYFVNPVSAATKFAYNDASLEQGGLFDVNANWKPEHCTHRVGENVDFRTRHLTPSQRKEALSILKYNNINIHPESDHWHLTDGQSNFSNFSGVGPPLPSDVCANSK